MDNCLEFIASLPVALLEQLRTGNPPVATPQSNTLLITNLDASAFDAGGASLRSLIGEFSNGVVRFAPIRSFGRFLVVFDSLETAARVKINIHNHPFLGGKLLKVYFGQNTEARFLEEPGAGSNAMNFLQVPPIEKNFLLSPPGSPPIGWVQPSESLPSQGGHHQAMVDALANLPDDHFALDENTETMNEYELDGKLKQHRNSYHTESTDSMQSESSHTSSKSSCSHHQHRHQNHNHNHHHTQHNQHAHQKMKYTIEGAVQDERVIHETRGYKATTRTKHILTFEAPALPSYPGEVGGMEWEMTLPIVVVEDHDESEGDDGDGMDEKDGSNDSLQHGISVFSMNVSGGGDGVLGSEESLDHSKGKLPLSRPALSIPKTALPPSIFRH